MKHSKDTIRKYIRRGNFYIAYYSQFDACDIKLCVSYGNKKSAAFLTCRKLRFLHAAVCVTSVKTSAMTSRHAFSTQTSWMRG